MTRKYILTGAPSCGKSSVLLELELRGKHIVREAAEDWIKIQKARGFAEPWRLPEFQDNIFKLQKLREEGIPTNFYHAFIDRGYADGLAYATQGSRIAQKLNEAMRKTTYEKVFLIERLETHEMNEIRRENSKEAEEIELKIERAYQELGYTPIRIPRTSTLERCELLLAHTYDSPRKRVGESR